MIFYVVHSLSHVWLFSTTWTTARQASLPFTISWSFLKLMSIESVIPSDHLVLYHPLLLLPQCFPASGSFPMSQLYASGGQSIGASALVFPMSIQDWFPLGLMGLISSLSLEPSRVFSNTTIWKHQFFGPQPSFWSTNILGLLKIMLLSTKWGPILYFETYLEIFVNIAQ